MSDLDKITKNSFEDKVKHATKKYNSAWENYKEFKDWIAPSKIGERYFYCKLCKFDYHGGIDNVKLHNKTHKSHPVSKKKMEVIELTEENFNQVAGT